MATDLLDYLFDRAQRQANDHLFEEAIDTCKELLRRTGPDPVAEARAHGFLGDLYLLLREITAAERHISRAVNCQPENGEYHYLMGCLLTICSRWPEAISSFSNANSLMPGNAEVMRGLGWAIHCTGDSAGAEDLLRKAVSVDPQNVSALNDLCVCLMTQNRYDEAAGIISYAIEIAPGDPLLIETKEAVYQLRLEYNRSIADTERARRAFGSRGYDKPVYAKVEELFDRSLRYTDRTVEQRENARKMWQDFLGKSTPQIRRPEVWAATIEYAINLLDSPGSVDRTEIAERYQVTGASIRQAHRRLTEALSLTAGNRTYSARNESKSNHPSVQ